MMTRMYPYPLRLALMGLGCLAGLLSACDKKAPAAPQGGALVGHTTPAEAVTAVTASTSAGPAQTISPDSRGDYAFGGLPSGNYIVSYTVAPGYLTPATQNGLVTAPGTTALPTVSVAVSNTPGRFSFQINATPVAATLLNGFYESNFLTIGGNTTAAGQATAYGASFQIGPLSRPGTYGIAAARGYCNIGTVQYAFTSGTVQLSSLITSPARRASGTFSGTAVEVSGSRTAAITNGVFTNIPLR